ncbi:DNA repair protein RecO, partial [Patescibacteria group bacterium]|nr:DNA repair protein RecO [Patescibacteria group bacterium]
MDRTYKTEGIILKRINYGEADRILTIYTKHYGKIRALAKGVRRITSRRGGNVELFNQAVLFLNKGKNLDLLTEAQVVNSFKSWRRDLKKVTVAYYFCELVDKLTPEEQPNQAVFQLLSRYLGKIGTAILPELTRSFEEALLRELGFGVPEELRRSSNSLRDYIESITEKKL